jgi:eukaryotic-like serine/threonine-protein kinase
MTLTSGTHLGSYEILSAIGAGGMGEVYRARDTRLDRTVAIKVVPEAFARDAERMARFEREAKLLASLNHTNVAAIYGLEDSNGTRGLVMELVEGPTLADRIRSGPIPIDEALQIAKQITEALEYAHERGVVHRDLKPANIKVSRHDAVKILDFGLAKAVEGEAVETDISTSPTLTRMATQAGFILGTAAYMSPEQAKGKPVDRRADIWAFGCVLYEMLTGKMAFSGETVTDTLAAVVRAEPDWSVLPAGTPLRVRVLLQRCLQKDPKQRLRDIGDARIAVEEQISGALLEAPSARELGAATGWRARFSRAAILPLCIACLIVAAIAGLAVWVFKPAPTAAPRLVSRTVIALPPGDQIAALDYPAIAISKDGTRIAYSASHAGRRQIYLRELGSLDAKPVPDTENGLTPFFSPDGQWLGFFGGARLRKIDLNGGSAVNLAGGTIEYGASWTGRGTIIFAPNIGALQEVSDNGGAMTPVTALVIDKGETQHGWPYVLPGDKAVLFVTGPDPERIAVQPLPSGQRQNLGSNGTSPAYAASGHLVYVQDGNLMAVGFDRETLHVTGTPVPVVQGILQLSTGAAQYSVSGTGTLVYIPGSLQGGSKRIVWVSRNGTEQVLSAPANSYTYPRLSPDGHRLAVTIRNPTAQTWIYDFDRGALTRLTFNGTENEVPVWSPDGKRIAHISNTEGPVNMYWEAADGSGGFEPLKTTQDTEVPSSFSPDGKFLAYVDINGTTGYDIWVMRMSDRTAEPFLKTQYAEAAPRFSPDGHWIAYVSDESGRYEVYVQPYPGPGGKYQISTDGGTEPIWNSSGKELFYRNGDKMMAAEVSTEPTFSIGKTTTLFEGHYAKTSGTFPFYDVSPDGQRFLMFRSAEEDASLTQIVVVQNWFEELKRLVPSGTK